MPDLTDRTAAGSVDAFPDNPLDTWFVLRTRSRQEKILANELRLRGIGNFLPLISCTKYYGGRKANVELPVFPGYLFLRGDLDQAYTADRTRRIAQIIKVNDQEKLDQASPHGHRERRVGRVEDIDGRRVRRGGEGAA